jgi:hypothetical protein
VTADVRTTPPRARWLQGSLLAAFGLVLAAGLLPHLAQALRQFTADPVTAALQRGETIGQPQVERARAQLAAAGQAPVSAEIARELADLTFVRHARAAAGDPAALADLQVAEAALEAALRQSPADAYGWVRLAGTRRWLGRPDESVAAAAIASMELAPYARNLVVQRLQLALGAWAVLTPEQLDVVYGQVRFGYIDLNLRNEIIAVAKSSNATGFVFRALQDRTIFDGSNAQDDFFRLLRR